MSPEVVNGVFAVSGAVLGAIIAGFFSWMLQAKYKSKKKLKVFISEPRALVDIHDSLKGIVSININDEPVETVANVDYYILNSGNEALTNIELEFSFSDNARILGGNTPQKNFKTKGVGDFSLHLEKNSSCEILAAYLNPGEEVRGHLLLNRMPKETEVKFRQPNVEFEVSKNYDPTKKSMLIDALYEAAKNNYILNIYFKMTIPVYRRYRKGI
ncbi:hypothetical protein [Thiopseudomonas alkaliphila]|uniref:hypothetical protein n=1 Tax=Thiopseudomonas alkaliphila TaxID=1697053 RepID=UPI00257885B5|nr:hypothetical protein [Thiopseudomonas alkaliphila]MDM1708989.1 hypothetical protein [Thiopseudomonas alkaliphila]